MNKIALFGFSANPPAKHHTFIVKNILKLFGKVIIIPRGTDSNKPSTFETTSNQRKEMVNLVFSDIPNLDIDFNDLDNEKFTPTWALDQKYKRLFPDSEIWHVVGGDIVVGGQDGNSEIQKKWQKGEEIWEKLNWAIIDHPGFPINIADLPPKNFIIKMTEFKGRSTEIRNKMALNESITKLVTPKVREYIIKNNLYKNKTRQLAR